MLEHVSVPISDYKRSRKFYVAALKPLGYEIWAEYPPHAAGFVEGGSASLWIAARRKKVYNTIHVAMRARSRKTVKDFYDAALRAGGEDNGGPGFRLEYGDNYYAAFVYDPDGNNIEACYFGAKAPAK